VKSIADIDGATTEEIDSFLADVEAEDFRKQLTEFIAEPRSIRVWLAGMALQGYLAGRNNTRAENPMNFEADRAAKDCCHYADALIAHLASRERKDGA